MNFKKYILVISCILIISFLFTNLFVSAEEPGQGEDDRESSGSVKLADPLGTEEGPNVLIGKIINGILSVVGSLALLMFIAGGLTWMLAAGNQERVKKGRDILVWATVGLIVIFSSYALVFFVFKGLGVDGTG